MSAETEYDVIVQWGDCDPAQIVFYPNYFAWFDAAAQAFFASRLPPKRELMERHGIVGFPIAEASARFLRPSTWGQRITFRTTARDLQEKRFTLVHQGFRDGELLLEGREVRFAGRAHPQDPKRLQSIALPAEVVAALGGG